MLFNLEVDSGDIVQFYVVPDAYSAIPVVSVFDNVAEILTLEANEIREALVSAGRHENGRCGFRLDEQNIAGLARMEQLSVYEKETGVLIYRRPVDRHIQKKVLRIETSLLPLLSLDKLFSTAFQHYVRGIERFGLETSTQLFLLGSINSVYLSGRILYRNYSFYIEGSYQVAICLDDPYVMLAERLLILSKLENEKAVHVLGERDAHLLRQAIGFAAELNFEDGRAIRRSLRNLPQEVAVGFVNPLTRQLTCTAPDEMPRRGAVAGALDVLASFEIVGLREEENSFVTPLVAFTGLASSGISMSKPLTKVAMLAQTLRSEGQVEALLESDIELYAQVKNAHQFT